MDLNGFSDVPTDNDLVHPSVRTLYFSGNNISSNDLPKLGELFPELHNLILSECPIQSLPNDLSEYFPDLECLSLNNTSINSWNDLDTIRLLPNLTEVKLVGIPLMEASIFFEYLLLIIIIFYVQFSQVFL